MRWADDRERIRAAVAGDQESFACLVRKYQTAVYAAAMQRVGSALAAEEIAQDVFLTAYRKLGQLRDPDRFAGWLGSITVQRCRMWLRTERQRRRTALSARPITGDDAVAGDRTSRSVDGLFRIDELIAALPQRLRASAVLCLVNELSPLDASALLGLKPGTLRKRLHDARARLQRQIVQKAEKELLIHFLPRDFAEKCVCRCARAQEKRTRKEVMTMARKRNCGCGCTGTSRRKAKVASEPRRKKRK